MTAEEKLEKVEELIAKRDEITQELLELMGAETEEDDEAEEEEPTTHANRLRKCSGCGKPGHTKSKCPGSSAKQPTSDNKKRQPCDVCGSVGTRHFKTCSRLGKSKPAGITSSNGVTILDNPLRLTRQQFDEIREQAIDGITAEMICYSYPEFELSEIQRAIRSDSYQFYIK